MNENTTQLHQVENHEYVVPRGSKMEKEVIDGAVKICEPIQMKMLDPCFEPWIEHYYKKWKSKLQMDRECTENNEHYNWIMRNEPDSHGPRMLKLNKKAIRLEP